MKKKIITIVLVTMLFSSVVSAASLWGTYKGNDIIRLTVDGNPIKVTDVPAINYDNRTMIPIYLLGQAGINYTWDQANKTVHITKKDNKSSLNVVKGFVELANVHKALEDLGEELQQVKTSYDLAFLGIQMGDSNQLRTANSNLSNSINNYNNVIARADVINSTPKDAKISTIIQNYYDAIEKLKEMDSFLQQKTTINSVDINKFGNISSSAGTLMGSGLKSSRTQYSFYINLSMK